MDKLQILYYTIAFLLGFFYAFTELLAKYKEVSDIIAIRAGWVYMILNGVISGAAYFLLSSMTIKVDGSDVSETSKILISGISAMAIFRSSVFSIKVPTGQIRGDAAPIIQILLDWVHNKFDQKRAGIRIEAVKQIMINVDFEKAELILPDLCIDLMKTLTIENQENIGKKVAKIKSSVNLGDGKIDVNFVRSLKLGIIIAEYAGIGILRDAVNKLNDIISKN